MFLFCFSPHITFGDLVGPKQDQKIDQEQSCCALAFLETQKSFVETPQSKIPMQWFSNLAIPYCHLENKKSWAWVLLLPTPLPKFWFISLGWGPSISFKCSPFFNVIQWTARLENSRSNENNRSKQEWFVEFQPCPEWDTAKVFNSVFRETNLWLLKKATHTYTLKVSFHKKISL